MGRIPDEPRKDSFCPGSNSTRCSEWWLDMDTLDASLGDPMEARPFFAGGQRGRPAFPACSDSLLHGLRANQNSRCQVRDDATNSNGIVFRRMPTPLRPGVRRSRKTFNRCDIQVECSYRALAPQPVVAVPCVGLYPCPAGGFILRACHVLQSPGPICPVTYPTIYLLTGSRAGDQLQYIIPLLPTFPFAP
jgi:hypothetical protein